MLESEEDVIRFDWDIRLEGRAWDRSEFRARLDLAPEKIELFMGKLFGAEEQRLTMLALLLENVGAEKAVRLGSPEVWRRAVESLGESS